MEKNEENLKYSLAMGTRKQTYGRIEAKSCAEFARGGNIFGAESAGIFTKIHKNNKKHSINTKKRRLSSRRRGPI
jgi:hypothetical protein